MDNLQAFLKAWHEYKEGDEEYGRFLKAHYNRDESGELVWDSETNKRKSSKMITRNVGISSAIWGVFGVHPSDLRTVGSALDRLMGV